MEQKFDLNISFLEKILFNNYSLENIQKALGITYKLIRKNNADWTFQDVSSSSPANISIVFEPATKKLRSITFTFAASKLEVFANEAQNKLGYSSIRATPRSDDYLNPRKEMELSLGKQASRYGEGVFLGSIAKIVISPDYGG